MNGDARLSDDEQVEAVVEAMDEAQQEVGESVTFYDYARAAIHAARLAQRAPLPENHPLRCASCGDRATTTILLEGFSTPVCLRHYNVWQTPDLAQRAPGLRTRTRVSDCGVEKAGLL